MTRTLVRALACALTLIAMTVFAGTGVAAANPGDPPEDWNTITGWGSSSPGPFQHNWDEAAVGDPMEAQHNDWANGAYSYTSSWQRCIDTAANGCAAISGATTTSYTLTGSDVGKTVRFCSTASTGTTMCTVTTKKVVQTHTDTDGDGVLDFADSCYQQTGLAPGCPDYAHQPALKNTTTGGDVDSELAAGDLLEGDASIWTGGKAPYTYEWRRCFDQWCSYGSELVYTTPDTKYLVWYQDYGYSIQFCAIDSTGIRMCSKGAGPLGVRPSHTDTDKDGVADYKDKCPSSAALTSDGCPAPTTPATTPEESPQPVQTTATAAAGPAQGAATPAQANGVGADRAAQLTALINNRSRSMKVGFGKWATISGRLVDASGRPISNAQLVVLARRTAASAKFAKVTTITTDANGRYSYVAPAGTSRVVRIVYYAFANDNAVADATDVTLLVPGALTLKAPKHVGNMETATFRGRLRGKPMPSGGVLVDLQVWFHHKWRTFATPRSNGRGLFRFKYRFTRGAAKWTFRARIRKDSLYPYELGYSKQLSVVVR